MAVAVALVLVWLSPDARGATTAPRIDGDPQGALYVAGELLVSYEPGASKQHVGEVVEQSRARVKEKIPVADTQLLSFPTIKHDEPLPNTGGVPLFGVGFFGFLCVFAAFALLRPAIRRDS
jgi:hypothetical protein